MRSQATARTQSSWNVLNLEGCKRLVLLCCNNIDILEEIPNRRKDSSVPGERTKVLYAD